MIDQLISSLKDKVGGDLLNKFGLDQTQTDGALKAAGNSVQEVAGGGADLSSVLNLFSKDGNSTGGNDLLSKLGSNYLEKLTGQVGLNATKASSVKDLVIPLLTKMLSEKIGGNKDMLSSLLGGGAKGAVEGLTGKLGGLGKMFGK